MATTGEDTRRSGTATAENGRQILNERFSSVLSHPLIIPLILELNNIVVDHAISTAITTVGIVNVENIYNFHDNMTQVNRVLQSVRNNDDHSSVTSMICNNINHLADNGLPFKAISNTMIDGNNTRGKIDLALLDKDPSTSIENSSHSPLMVIKVGMKHSEWWTEFSHCAKHLEILSDRDTGLCFRKPLLMAAVTINTRPSARETSDNKDDNNCALKVGIFFCRPKKDKSKFRMTLLWHSRGSFDLFGKLLMFTAFFEQMVKQELTGYTGYEYFSSNCSRFGDKVLRCYDNRFIQTSRTPIVYLEGPHEVVGDCMTLFIINPETEYTVHDVDTGTQNRENDIWTKKDQDQSKSLTVISTPHRTGVHIAKTPRAFVPLIDRIDALHKAGFVHGDIRALNAVIDENETTGEVSAELIDFDYGGRVDNVGNDISKSRPPTYPDGYRSHLADGHRYVSREANENILKWHDWLALARLVFFIYQLKPATSANENAEMNRSFLTTFCSCVKTNVDKFHIKWRELEVCWLNIKEDPDDKMIQNLKQCLQGEDLQRLLNSNGWIYKCTFAMH